MVAAPHPKPAPPAPAPDTLSLGFGQARLILRTRDAVLVLLVALLVCVQLVFSWRAFEHLSRQHVTLIEEFRIQTWMLSRPLSERPQLVMPPGLRARLAERN